MRPWYDTKAGLESRLEDGLAGLHDIARARHDAYYKREERLQEWCILGMFWTDTCGNFSLIESGAPADGYPYWKMEDVYEVPRVMSREETGQFTSRWSAVMGLCLPPENGRCDRCGKGWTLQDVRNYYLGRHEGARPRHKTCQEMYSIEQEQKEFRTILERAEIPYSEMLMVPNGYHNQPFGTYFGPWFLVETPAGRIEIGWRKNVIHIDWSRTGLSATGSDIVDQPKVTCWRTGVHAWGADKAVEALRKLWSKG